MGGHPLDSSLPTPTMSPLSSPCTSLFDPFLTYHRATQQMMKEPRQRPTPDTVNLDLLAAKLSGDRERTKECHSLLRLPSTITALGDIEYERIGLLHEVDFIKHRRQVRIILQSMVYASMKGSTVGQFNHLRGFNFVRFVDSCQPLNPFSMRSLDNSTLLCLLRWAYSTDSLLVIAEVEEFLLSESGSDLFNDYQLLHLAHRFDMPKLRMRCLSSLRSLDDMDDFKGDDNYDVQLSKMDHALLSMRVDYLRHLESINLTPDAYFFLWDFHSGCTFEESIKERYIPFEPKKEEPMEEDDGNGFDGEITGLF
ncbi:hypothetical protein PENTCL1PPCAC_6199 [Pristionchus entomophagus]|uniref:BTB domain-containing protein n=1 Tax=Pristionchus entomophagus TaxID=358040 RepID=A0AAV5SUX3_9BILA|nr:hypothetical protein PENTCL1PPCAC_6199 [Pristionchus entomophagus]